LVLYGNHVCHLTVHWLSLDNEIIKIIIKSLEIRKIDVEIREQANRLKTLAFFLSTISRL